MSKRKQSLPTKRVKPTFDINAVISKTLLEYVQTPDWSVLKEELEAHTYAQMKWKVVRDPSCTETDPRFSNIKRILFVNETSVIVQDVEMSCGHTRFETHKVYFEDWGKCFISWAEERKQDWDECWVDGCRMYGAQV